MKANYSIPEYMAAETIQQAYKRYKACAGAIKMKRINSVEKLVMNIAADTIKKSFLSRKRIKDKKRLPFPAFKIDDDKNNSNNPTENQVIASQMDLSPESFIEILEIKCSDLWYLFSH